MKIFARWLMRIAVLLVILGIPFTALGGMSMISGNETDAVSSATAYAFDPNDVSGEYVVFINNDRHSDTAAIWSEFFRGGNIPVILDDISCLVCSNDTLAKDYAEICQARLPENQMKIKSENTLLLLSKGDSARFDIIIMSKEMADAYRAETISANSNVTTVNVL